MIKSSPEPVGEGVVQAVLFCARLSRLRKDRRGVSTSRPGHLIQLMIAGETDLEAGGRHYRLRPGHLIWYHEDELVHTHVRRVPWTFYSVNFLAPALEPPPFEQRVVLVHPGIRGRFARLLRVWRDMSVPAMVRRLRVHGELTSLLGAFRPLLEVGRWERGRVDEASRLWWELENRLRQDLSVPFDLSAMERLTGRSMATIARSCRAAVGMPPMKRMRQVRMSLARGLVKQSTLRLSEIAARLGYGRPHEFSRDYRRHFGVPPREDRRSGGA